MWLYDIPLNENGYAATLGDVMRERKPIQKENGGNGMFTIESDFEAKILLDALEGALAKMSEAFVPSKATVGQKEYRAVLLDLIKRTKDSIDVFSTSFSVHFRWKVGDRIKRIVPKKPVITGTVEEQVVSENNEGKKRLGYRIRWDGETTMSKSYIYLEKGDYLHPA